MKYRLGDLARISSSKRIYAKEYTTSGIPFYRGKEIIELSSGHLVSNKLFISKDRFNQIRSKYNDVPEKDDVLITAVGTIGETYLVKSRDLPFYFKDGNLIKLSKWNRQIVSPEYMYYWLNSYAGKMAIKKITIGSTQQAITIGELSDIELDLPPISEQGKIAQRLSILDVKIDNNKHINANLLELAKSIYHKTLASSILVETRLKDFATITMGQSPSSKTYNENGVGIALLNGAADFRNGIHPSKWTTDAKRIVDKGAYIFGVRATIGLTTKVFNKYAIGRGTGSAVAKDTVNDEFLYFILDDMFKDFANTGSGSVYINISKSDFNDYIFRKPQVSDLQTFHQIVSLLMSKIYANKKENLALNQLKEILLNRFF